MIGARRWPALYLFGAALVTALSWPAASEATHGGTHIPGTTYATDHTWTRAGSPYVVDDNVTVNAGATLTIEPGVVVKLSGQNRRITVYGTLRAEGTQARPIHITSIQDDSVGGDSGGDGITAGAPGQWYRIHVRSGASAFFDWATVSYGGFGSGYYTYAAIDLEDGAHAELDHSILAENQSSGLLLKESASAEVRRSWLHHNGSGISALFTSPDLDLSHSIVTDNAGDGVHFLLDNDYSGVASEITDSDIAHNGRYGVFVWAVGAPQLASLPHGNRNNVVRPPSIRSTSSVVVQRSESPNGGGRWRKPSATPQSR